MGRGREKIEFDVLFVGGGPANLAGAIHLMQLATSKGIHLEVAMIEKGAEIGCHALSGAVLNPIALAELMPDYREKGCPIEVDVRGEELRFLTETSQYRVPFVPRYMKNRGFHIISLSRFVRWLAEIAEGLGVNIFPGFAGKEVRYASDRKTVIGIRTGDKGLGKDGRPRANFEPGIDILAKVTVLGEGAGGSLLREVSGALNIFSGKMPQTFETGIKEVIELPEGNYFLSSRGNVIHTFGYPLGLNTHGGGFIYQMKDNRVSVGFVVGLSYRDPMLDLYEEFMRFKRHPFAQRIISGGRVLEHGARTLTSSGYYSIPKLSVDGAVFVGTGASMLNAPALKGIHTSMKSGMLAAETMIEAFQKGDFTQDTLNCYQELIESTWLKEELYRGRNFAQTVSKEGLIKFFHLGAQYLTGGRGIIDKMPIAKDSDTLKSLRPEASPRKKVKAVYDDVLFVDKLTGVYLSKTQHREDQPSHLVIHDPKLCVEQCFRTYRCPCTRFCPGNVYELEIDENTDEKRLKVNPANCLHCKTCEIKDPYGNITWTCPEGGDGPKYTIV
ncbi:MAG: electron transfer flavoprotein-ubiquinone oxidoreductase [Deltaproteobacteria bacterium]|nr:MAG: electron transfer flavoprotein-ubiquinone oxidoreductase [Deltaproteobacteria bacterium]